MLTDKRNCYCCLMLGSFLTKWIRMQNFFSKIVTSVYFELFIVFTILINIIIMSIQYYDQPQEMQNLQDYSNYVRIVNKIFKRKI